VSVAEAASLLSSRDIAAIHQLQLDGLATALALGGFELTLYRLDAAGVPQPMPPVRVARRWANRQPQERGSEAARSGWIAGDFRAYAPVDWQVGDTFALPDGSGRLVPPITEKDGMVTAGFTLDQGNP
jgi:hypothetical protein